MKGESESLVGRVGLLELENLSLQEMEQQIDITTDRRALVTAMVRGQFPELWRLPDFPSREFYSAYVATYLERDVRQILNVTSLRDFERFLRILAVRSGGMLNKSDVARDVGVSVKAIGDWLSVLQASGQIVLLEPWFTNITKRMVKTPKVYFRDSGLLCFLLNLTEQSVLASPLLGAVWETIVFSELRKLNAALAEPVNFWYYRDQRSREIDFILEAGGKLSFVEAKWQEQPGKREANTMLEISQELDHGQAQWRSGPHFIVGTPSNRFSVTEGIDATGVNDIPAILAEVIGRSRHSEH
jgi:predicted AAA+ superfamily ATPase